MGEFQVRSESTGIRNYISLEAAFQEAKRDLTIWKISFFVGDERVRLIRAETAWVYEDVNGDRHV